MRANCERLTLVTLAAITWTATADAQPLDFVTVGAAANAPYLGVHELPGGLVTGRGAVGYEFQIARNELTTSQWMEFVNTFANTDPSILPERSSRTIRGVGIAWGATISGTGVGEPLSFALRSDLANAGNIPVSGMSWEGAAMYCNWLHNGKSSNPATLWSGAYDASTWAYNNIAGVPVPQHGDRLPGAAYWLPSLDEWLKATYYDPSLNNGAGGWWTYANSSNEAPIPGLPGVGTTSATLANGWELVIGSYPTQTSPWGLLDTSGGRKEWTDSWLNGPSLGYLHTTWKFTSGSSVQLVPGEGPLGRIDEFGAFTLFGNIDVGMRVARAVPTPGTAVMCAAVSVFAFSRRRSRCILAKCWVSQV